jgi:hypothetical protein
MLRSLASSPQQATELRLRGFFFISYHLESGARIYGRDCAIYHIWNIIDSDIYHVDRASNLIEVVWVKSIEGR